MRYKQSHFMSRFNLTPGKKSVFKARKEELINNFNDAVERGASEQYLKSLYSQIKWEFHECNQELGLLPQDGLSRLKWSE